MNAFDRLCAVLAFILAIGLIILGTFGLFAGCKANFSLPPVFGVLPALVGWGIVRSILIAWNAPVGKALPKNPPHDNQLNDPFQQ